ncbi:MAG: 3'(2'),5'-bisphosphate nucleotidase CysQ [Lachnospiraceae bacterium]|nr:3'(2'),5'-bisphosphate nucleotidase CysQ [Lachnospiraceae bacterium]
MDLTKELEIAKDLAVKAGEAIMEVYADEEKFNVTYKEGHMPLTNADRAANAIIVKGLKENFPDYAILSEEEKDDKVRLSNDYCFVVDPLDGTKEFIKRNGQFTVNIALSYQHKSVMGVIYVPVTEELYFAAKGVGAFYQAKGKEPEKIHVTEETDLTKVRLVMSSSHGAPEMDQLIEKYGFKNFVAMGSSLKGCLVAKGEAEIYYRHNPTMEWDTAAMQCIVEEAGAIFRQMDDTEMLYNREDSLNAKGFYIINDEKCKLSL